MPYPPDISQLYPAGTWIEASLAVAVIAGRQGMTWSELRQNLARRISGDVRYQPQPVQAGPSGSARPVSPPGGPRRRSRSPLRPVQPAGPPPAHLLPMARPRPTQAGVPLVRGGLDPRRPRPTMVFSKDSSAAPPQLAAAQCKAAPVPAPAPVRRDEDPVPDRNLPGLNLYAEDGEDQFLDLPPGELTSWLLREVPATYGRDVLEDLITVDGVLIDEVADDDDWGSSWPGGS